MRVVNAIIQEKEKVLLIKRAGGLQAGKWAFPGGVVEGRESDENALKREILEETGLEIKKIVRKVSDYNYKREDNSKTEGTSYLVLVKKTRLVKNTEVLEFKWASIEELESLNVIPGIEEEAITALFSSQ